MINQNVFFLGDAERGTKPKISVVLPSSGGATRQNVFAEALLEKSSTHQKRHPLKWVASLVAHVVVLVVLVLMPLYFSQGLNMQRLNSTLLVAPPPPMAAPPPPPPPAAAVPRVIPTAPKTFTPGKLTAPSYVPKAVAVSAEAAPPEESFSAMPSGVPGGLPGGQPGGMLGAVMAGVPGPAAPVEVPAGPKQAVRVGGAVKPPHLISGPAPVYPILAKQSKIHGTVVIEAIIDVHGDVVQERVISGHPLLVPAAMKAVSQRKYEPTVLNGEPTPVVLIAEVNFQMS